MMFERLMKRLSMAVAAGALAGTGVASAANEMVNLEIVKKQLEHLVIYRCEAEDRASYFVFEKKDDGLKPLPDYSDEGDVVTFSGNSITYVSGESTWVINPPHFTEVEKGNATKGKCADIAGDLVIEFGWIIEDQSVGD